MQFLLVHSPVVGPTTWRWVADELRAGHDVVVPDLRHAAAGGDVNSVIVAAAAAVPPEWLDVIAVGHSGAGVVLPGAPRTSAGAVDDSS
jgi:hypothetical protein